MEKMKYSYLCLAFILYFIPSLAFIYLLIKLASYPPVATVGLPVIMILLTVLLLFLGLHVKKYKENEHTNMNAITASRVLVFAKTLGYGGSCLAGFCAAQTVVFFFHRQVSFFEEMILIAFFGVVACIIACIAGVIVENWCVVDDDNNLNTGLPSNC